jgi:hypothetical protein
MADKFFVQYLLTRDVNLFDSSFPLLLHGLSRFYHCEQEDMVIIGDEFFVQKIILVMKSA